MQIVDFRELERIRDIALENAFDYDTKKISLKVNDSVHPMGVMRAYLNSMLLLYYEKDGICNIDKLIYDGGGSETVVTDYVNSVIVVYSSYQKDLTARQLVAQFIIDSMSRIALMVEHIDTNDISIFDIFDLMDEHPRFKEILMKDDHVNDTMTPTEIVHVKHGLFEELKNIVLETKIEPYYTLLMCGTGMRLAQFTDIMGMIGCSPDRTEVIPYSVGESWLRGLNNVYSWFVQNSTARIAKILEKCEIANTGYALKRAMFAYASTFVTEGDCGTVHMLDHVIKDKRDLKRFVGVNYKLSLNACGDYLKVKATDVHLIGQTIHYRSPIACNHIDGKICSTCMGLDVRTDVDIGIIIAMWIYGKASQDYLSAKHNNIATPIEHLTAEDMQYIKNTIRNTILFKQKPASIHFTAPTLIDGLYWESPDMVVEFESGEKREFSIPKSHDTAFRVHYDNLFHETFVKDFSNVILINKNRPKAALFTELTNIYINSSEIKKINNVRDIIKVIFERIPDIHASVIGVLTYKHVRDANNQYVRPNFTDSFISPTFESMHTILTTLPINESLPQGKDVGLERLLSSIETFNGVRKYSTFMDSILKERDTKKKKRG